MDDFSDVSSTILPVIGHFFTVTSATLAEDICNSTQMTGKPEALTLPFQVLGEVLPQGQARVVAGLCRSLPVPETNPNT